MNRPPPSGGQLQRRMARWFLVAGVAVYPLMLMFYQGWRSQSGLADSQGLGLFYALLIATMIAVPLLLVALVLRISNRSPD